MKTRITRDGELTRGRILRARGVADAPAPLTEERETRRLGDILDSVGGFAEVHSDHRRGTILYVDPHGLTFELHVVEVSR